MHCDTVGVRRSPCHHVGSERGDADESGRRRHKRSRNFCRFFLLGSSKKSFGKNSDSPIQAAKTDDLTNAERIAAIPKSRQQDKNQERQQATGLQQESSKEKKSADVIPLTPQPDDYSYTAFIDELFGDD
ncbi:hypothetical protein [Methylomonas methanica]|uniref:hypothetical protein n=1 Tax=Methylomonas methanica TaxID=421 RepID=UPI001A9CDA7A|nr:hypothetical protein [Methylomonas methanica]